LRLPCNGEIEGTSVYLSISRAQSLRQIYLLHELWPKNHDGAKSQYVKKATKQFAYNEDTKACKNRLDMLATSIAYCWGENHLHYFTHTILNHYVVCGEIAGIM